jgi:hypothetical protein
MGLMEKSREVGLSRGGGLTTSMSRTAPILGIVGIVGIPLGRNSRTSGRTMVRK